MTGNLLIVVPTRGRPGNIARLLDSVHATSKLKTHIHIGVDDDDPELENYHRVMDKAAKPGDELSVGPRKGLTEWTNEIAVPAAEEYPYLASFGDDMVPRTPGWDKALIEGIERMGGTGFTYPWDGTREDIPEACVVSSDIVRELGWFCHPDVSHWYCVVPETPVLTANLDWVPIGGMLVGDEVVGIDEWPVKARASRAFRRAKVTGIRRRVTECVLVEMEDGRNVTCSTEHKWLAKRHWKGTDQHGPGTYEWRESRLLKPGDLLSSPLRRTWKEETSFDAGWLSGMFDGEGTCGKYGNQGYPNVILSVAQNPGPVLDRLQVILKEMDINYYHQKRHAADRGNNYRCQVLQISSRTDAMELLGRLHPTRLNADLLWEDMPARSREVKYGIVRQVHPVGPAEVVSMSTSTGTYLANGLAAHNCDNVWADLGRGAGCIKHLRAIAVDHVWKSDSTSKDSSKKLTADRDAYYLWRKERMADDVKIITALRDQVLQPA